MVVHICHLGYLGSINRGWWSRLAWAKKQNPVPEITKAKRDRSMTHVLVIPVLAQSVIRRS
jgi:hypothetical protein